MYHLKILTKDTHPTAQDIANEIVAHPNRPYAIDRSEYSSFDQVTNKQLLGNNCSICIKSTDDLFQTDIKELIAIGSSKVNLNPKDFLERDLLIHLQDGASMIISTQDGFDLNQIKKFVKKGKENTFLLASVELTEKYLTDSLNDRASVLIKKGDGFNDFALTRIAKIGGSRINIQANGFTDFRLKTFLDAKAIITIGEGNKLSPTSIKALTRKYRNQIHISSAHFDDKVWLEKVEILGGVIV